MFRIIPHGSRIILFISFSFTFHALESYFGRQCTIDRRVHLLQSFAHFHYWSRKLHWIESIAGLMMPMILIPMVTVHFTDIILSLLSTSKWASTDNNLTFHPKLSITIQCGKFLMKKKKFLRNEFKSRAKTSTNIRTHIYTRTRSALCICLLKCIFTLYTRISHPNESVCYHFGNYFN